MKTGLALAGGGISGSAAIGVIQALTEAGITVTHIAGASSGSLVAALYAYGYSVEQLKQIIPQFTRKHLDLDWKLILSRLLRPRSRLDGWLKGERLLHLVEQLTESAHVSQFQIPCGIVATDLKSGEPLIFSNTSVAGFQFESEIEIAKAVQASFSIPVIFRPVRWKHYILADGGVSLNCPVQVVRAMGAEHVIAVDTVTAFANDGVGELRSAMSVFAHVINLNLRNQMAFQHQQADFSLYPHVGYVGAFDFHKVEQCVEAGYQYTWQRMEQIRAGLSK